MPLGTSGGVSPTHLNSPALTSRAAHFIPNLNTKRQQRNRKEDIMLTLECNYSKKIGLPGYSSHQFMVTLRSEITDLNTVQAESERLYGLLQTAVDTSLRKVGYLPQPAPKNGNGNGGSHGNGNGQDRWACSDKQQALILRITDEHRLDKNNVEQLAQERFGKGVRQLNKLEASGLIDELLLQTGQQPNSRQRFTPRALPAPAR